MSEQDKTMWKHPYDNEWARLLQVTQKDIQIKPTKEKKKEIKKQKEYERLQELAKQTPHIRNIPPFATTMLDTAEQRKIRDFYSQR